MKKNYFIVFLMLSFVFFQACSSDDSEITEASYQDIKIRKWVSATYRRNYDGSWKVSDSMVSHLKNNKLLESVSYNYRINYNNETVSVDTSTIHYQYDTDGKILKFMKKQDNKVLGSYEFSYDNEGRLKSYVYFSEDDYDDNYYKSVHTYANDTIYTNSSTKNEINDEYIENRETHKYVLSEKGNLVYYEANGPYYSDNNTVISTYDENSNKLTANMFGHTEFVYTYTDDINPEAFIYDATFGKEVYNLLGGETNAFATSETSKNVLQSVNNILKLDEEYKIEAIIDSDTNIATKITYNDGFNDEVIVNEFILE
ncbi:hypothetical protein [Zunongwangia sp. HGR-M22]|uniref:hypothetical protein n=1 Tax=Zunongwangia sp. HGR-M22 TaxID=3015168 RepID=UPI0022DD66AE|nr:hypothetical protein [Zunongwangia sp. HGR-M22]WBL24807.1 hypothetical protein PBT91_12920 [Zunongwangia sp. HGR-M22]